MSAASGRFGVVICTRNRPAQLHATLDALERQTWRDFPVLVVDQSDEEDAELTRRAAADPRLRVLRDRGRGLSRARNLALRETATSWLAYVDDDCLLDPDWTEQLDGVLAANPDVAYVSGSVDEHDVPGGEYLGVTSYRVDRERRRSGRRTRPGDIGYGVCMVLRRDVLARIGGWDERLGTGSGLFPASEDMDLNYRLLRAGGVALATPRLRAHHDQWRTADELPALFGGYMEGWSAFAVKQARTGDPLGGLRLWAAGPVNIARTFASALRRRSRLRARIAWRKLIGLVRGTARALRVPW